MAQITYFAPDTDAFVDSVVRHIGEFEYRSKDSVQLRIVPSDLYFSNRIHDYLAGESPADVFMSGPVLLWEHVGAGFVEPLDGYLGRANSGYDFADFAPGLIAANRWTGRFGDPLGAGSLLEIPVNCESYNLAYVPTILHRCGVAVPRTWAEYFVAANQIVERAGGATRGFAQRGIDVWHTMYTGYATQFWSYGARDFDDAGRCAIASPEGVHATEDFVTALRASGPADWLNQRWYELALDFGHGQYGLIVDSDHYVALFEDAKTSNLVGQIAYAPPPIGPSGEARPNLWTWSVVMNSRSRNKDAAWRFIEWATSRDFLLRAAFEGNMNPTRASIWEDPRFVAHARQWDGFYDVSHDLIFKTGRVLVTPAPNYLQLATRWVDALREAYAGERTVAEALSAAARDIDALVQA
jgi:multiple sugar transport system substrate-binding protein